MIRLGDMVIMHIGEHLTIEDIMVIDPEFRKHLEDREKEAAKEAEQGAKLLDKSTALLIEASTKIEKAKRLRKSINRARKAGSK